MATYKADQGTYARTAGFWLIGSLWAFGCYTLYYWLLSFRGSDGDGLMIQDLSGGNLPVLGVPLTWALLAATLLGLVGLVTLRRVLNKPKVADMLIETESELRKVTWPTVADTWKGTMAVVVTVAFMLVYLTGADMLIRIVMTRLLGA